MNQQIVYALIFLSIFLLLVVVSHVLYKVFNISSENSRKLLHVSGGVLALFAPVFFTSHWWVLILCSLAFLLLLFTYIKKWIPAIHETSRSSIGSVIFPVPLYLCFFIAENRNDELLFYLPISFLTISDAIAQWTGEKWGTHSLQLMHKQKTLIGSTGFAISALLIATGWAIAFRLGFEQIILIAFTTSSIATVTELISTKGWDNITVPLITVVCLLFLRSH
jgi:dolichol kinase